MFCSNTCNRFINNEAFPYYFYNQMLWQKRHVEVVLIQQFPTQLCESYICWIEISRSRGAIRTWGESNDACNAVYDGNNSSNTGIMTVLGVIVVHCVWRRGLPCSKITLSLSQQVIQHSVFCCMISKIASFSPLCESVYVCVLNALINNFLT